MQSLLHEVRFEKERLTKMLKIILTNLLVLAWHIKARKGMLTSRMLTSSDSNYCEKDCDHLLLLAGCSGSIHRNFPQSAPGRLANIIHGDRRKACTGCTAGHAGQQGHSKVVTAYRLEASLPLEVQSPALQIQSVQAFC